MVTLLAKSVVANYTQLHGAEPALGTHVDDIFGGFKDFDYDRACHFREFLCSMGASLSVYFNPKPNKTPMPSTVQVILGRQYDSSSKRVNTDTKKVTKYRLRIASSLAVEGNSKKDIERLHGSLNYVAAVEPFGRPFLSHLTTALTETGEESMIHLSELARYGLKIWDLILRHNKGIAFDFILDRLPRSRSDIFVDASSSWGIGGCMGEYYFTVPWEKLAWVQGEIIARRELLACVIAILCFGDLIEGKLVRLYTDNDNASH